MLYTDKKHGKEGFIVAQENEKEEMQSVTIRIPKELYFEYKQALLEQGKIVTYDVRRHMNDVVENHKKGHK